MGEDKRAVPRKRRAFPRGGLWVRYPRTPSQSDIPQTAREWGSVWEARSRGHHSASALAPSWQALTVARSNLPTATAIFSARGSGGERPEAEGAGPAGWGRKGRGHARGGGA